MTKFLHKFCFFDKILTDNSRLPVPASSYRIKLERKLPLPHRLLCCVHTRTLILGGFAASINGCKIFALQKGRFWLPFVLTIIPIVLFLVVKSTLRGYSPADDASSDTLAHFEVFCCFFLFNETFKLLNRPIVFARFVYETGICL